MATSTYTPIFTNTLSSSQTNVTWSSIPQTYTDLKIVFSGTVTTQADSPNMYFNGDTGTNYSWQILYALSSGGNAVAARASNVAGTSNWIGANGWSNSLPNVSTVDIMNYTSSANKSYIANTYTPQAALALEHTIGLYRSSSPITTIRLGIQASGTYNSGTTFTLYGIKAA